MTVDLRLVAARVADGDAEAFRRIVELTRAPVYEARARFRMEAMRRHLDLDETQSRALEAAGARALRADLP